MVIKSLLETLNHNLTLFIILPAIICIGSYLTIKLRFLQFTKIKKSFQCLTQKNPKEHGNISRFEAIAAVLAGNFGTGNISGMAVALTTGGPGALVWMWVMAFFGAAIQYASCVLSVSFRQKTESGEYAGGPMYYLRDGLGQKTLAAIFSVATLFGAITVGNFAQINSIVLPLQKMGLNPLYCSIVIAIFSGVVILGGIQRLAQIASYIVPFKAILYLGTALWIICANLDQLLPALKLMYQHAFGIAPVVGGGLGFGVLQAMTTGFNRGLFATDAGTGNAPILQANTRSSHPVLDGIGTLIAPLMVMIVCTATGLVLLLTGAWQTDLQSTNMVIHAFSKGLGSPVGGYIVMISLIIFAYTTILAWAYCGEKAWEFLVGQNKHRWFQIAYILLIPINCFLHVNMIWILSDLSITLMLLLNLIGITGLSHHVIRTSRAFYQSEKASYL